MKAKATNTLIVAALVISTGSLVLSLQNAKESSSEYPDIERIETLERELAYLKGRIYRGVDFDSEEFRQDVVRPQLRSLNFEYTRNEQAASVERSVDEMRWTMTVRGLMPPTAEHIHRSKHIIFDDQVDIKEKLVALRILQQANARSDKVVNKMIEEYHQTRDDDMKVEILSHLDDVNTPELVHVLLEASAKSPDSRIREEAIDSLSGYLPDPDLMDWLAHVEANDSEKRVRNEASRLIKKYGAKSESNN